MDTKELASSLANITTGLEKAVAMGDLGAITNLVAELGRLRTTGDLGGVTDGVAALEQQCHVEHLDGGDNLSDGRRSQVVFSTGTFELSGRVYQALTACYRHCVRISGKEMARQVMLDVVTEIMDECDGLKPRKEAQS